MFLDGWIFSMHDRFLYFYAVLKPPVVYSGLQMYVCSYMAKCKCRRILNNVSNGNDAYIVVPLYINVYGDIEAFGVSDVRSHVRTYA